MTRVAVFGGSGFLGLHVVEELLRQGYEVVVADLKPVPKGIPAAHLAVDICDLDGVRRALEGVRYVYNFAGVADIDEAADDPVTVARVNVLGNVHVLDACVRDRKSTRLNSSHGYISYAVFCLKKKKQKHMIRPNKTT